MNINPTGWHVKNPLTVIAIFASLAEVFGVITLPKLHGCVQVMFTVFVMLFPCLLVCLFFYVLWHRHEVLYAPSDYSDERNFNLYVRKGSLEQQLNKIDAEVDDELAGKDTPVTGGNEGESIHGIPISEGLSAPNDVAPENQDLNPDGTEHLPSPSSLTVLNSRDELRARIIRAEEYGISKIQSEYPYRLTRSVSVGDRREVFDAVHISHRRALVIEVKYTRGVFYRTQTLALAFSRVNRLFENLEPIQRKNFEFVYLIVAEKNAPAGAVDNMVNQVNNIARKFSFKTSVRVIRMDDEKA